MNPMNPSLAPDGPSQPPKTAGQMLRAAREAQGLHLAVLSVNLKVNIRQLEALEADRYDVLKGASFVRALAQSVCRQLKIDPVLILAALPKSDALMSLEPVALGSRPTVVRRRARSGRTKGLSRQVLLLAMLMLAGAAALIWWPNLSLQEDAKAEAANTPAASEVVMGQAQDPEQMSAEATGMASEPAAPASVATARMPVVANPVVTAPAPTPVASAPVPAAASVQSTANANSTLAPLFLHSRADAWVEVRDSRGQMAVRRTVKAGETLNLNLAGPLFVYVGRADGAELRWQGQAIDLKPHTQNNEARLQLRP